LDLEPLKEHEVFQTEAKAQQASVSAVQLAVAETKFVGASTASIVTAKPHPVLKAHPSTGSGHVSFADHPVVS
jgi:hypothetical protein